MEPSPYPPLSVLLKNAFKFMCLHILFSWLHWINAPLKIGIIISDTVIFLYLSLSYYYIKTALFGSPITPIINQPITTYRCYGEVILPEEVARDGSSKSGEDAIVVNCRE